MEVWNLILSVLIAALFSADANIRHGRSRGRLFRGSRHGDDFQEDYGEPSLAQIQENPIYSDENNTLRALSHTLANTPKPPRRVTMDMNFTSTTNSSWQHMDKTVLYIGDRALGQPGKRYRNETRRRPSAEEETETFVEDSFLEDIQVETRRIPSGDVDIVTRFLRIVESQHLLGENCTAGTDLNLGEGVVDRYAQERFRVEADVAVNRANMLTRIWKYADPSVLNSEYLLHASVFSMVEFDDDIFAAGNCYDQYQYKDYWLFCPYAYRLPEGTILVKDLAVEYKYLSNTSEWFYIARKNAEKVIKNYNQFSRGKCSSCLERKRNIRVYILFPPIYSSSDLLKMRSGERKLLCLNTNWYLMWRSGKAIGIAVILPATHYITALLVLILITVVFNTPPVAL